MTPERFQELMHDLGHVVETIRTFGTKWKGHEVELTPEQESQLSRFQDDIDKIFKELEQS